MIDPIVSLAFSIYSTPGAYAILIGSGVSRSAGIPTGWEIVTDLIQKIAVIANHEIVSNPDDWFAQTYGEPPNYSKLIEVLAKSPIDRRQLLKSYFEPSPEEKEEGLKEPTRAHKAIAELVVEGFVKVIITTNFDRLLEKALEDKGVTPVVISTADAVEGAPPAAHMQCTVLKVHGDYLDTRIKNSPTELSSYDDRINELLDRIFDEYGLVTCGWSAEWDLALRDAISRSMSQRYTLYWTSRGDLGEAAQQLINLRRAQIISIKDADSFFSQLSDKVLAIREVSARRHPISSKLATATVKRYMTNSRHTIALHDLVTEETERVYKEMVVSDHSVESAVTDDEFLKRVEWSEVHVSVLQAVLITGCYWGGEDFVRLCIKAIERIANPPDLQRGIVTWLDLRKYPALILLYSTGLASIAAENYETLVSLLSIPVADKERHEKPFVLSIDPDRVIDKVQGQLLSSIKGQFAPLSDHLFKILREPLREYLPDDLEYKKAFDRFEYIKALTYVDLEGKDGEKRRGPIGSFGWRYRHTDFDRSIMLKVQEEVISYGRNWPLLEAGLFSGSTERFWEIKDAFDAFLYDKISNWI